jgi:hypothetical protein
MPEPTSTSEIAASLKLVLEGSLPLPTGERAMQR